MGDFSAAEFDFEKFSYSSDFFFYLFLFDGVCF